MHHKFTAPNFSAALSIQPKHQQVLVRRWLTLTSPLIWVGPTEKSLSFGKIVVPSTALLYPACSRNNKQTRGGLERICETRMNRSIGHVEFRNFKPKCLLNGKLRGTCVSFSNSQYQGLLVPRDFLQKSTGEEVVHVSA